MHASSVGSSLAVVVDGLRFFAAMPCVCPVSYDEEAYKKRDGRNGEDGDRPAEAGTDLWGGAGGSVTAHAAALRVGDERGREKHHRHEANAEKFDLSKAGAHVRAY
jgi:hypothetical protein